MTNLWHLTSVADAVPLSREIADHYDMIIIGGGFTGLSAAIEAATGGASVLVVEGQKIGHGGSGRNVGLVNAGLWLPPGDVAKAMGPRAAERLTATLATGPQTVFDLIETYQISCEAVRNGTLHCAHSPSGFADLQRRHAQLSATGAPVSLLDSAEARRRVGSDKVHGALFDPRAGTIQPLAYARGLARVARSAGAQILEDTRATQVKHDGSRWTLMAGDRSLTATALIEATNAYSDRPDRFAPLRFFQMATDPLPEDLLNGILPGREGCWDTGMVMSSFRRDAEGRVIVGAIGSLDHGLSRIHRVWAQRKMAALFPQLKDVPLRHEWTGTIANTSDHLPKITRLGPKGYAAFGYSGRGIGTGTLFGKAMTRALLDDDDSGLPLAPVDRYVDRFTRLRGLWYETGALAWHAMASVREG